MSKLKSGGNETRIDSESKEEDDNNKSDVGNKFISIG